MSDAGARPANADVPGMLESFVSGIARSARRLNSTSPGPRSDLCTAVVLFADIIGFSAMSARLAQETLRGPEEVRRIINQQFDWVLSAIHEAGGEVVSLFGDAVVVLWPAPDGSDRQGVAVTAARALACGLHIQQLAAQRQAAGDSIRQMRIVLNIGEVRLATVGGAAGHWLRVTSGPAISALGAIDHSAGAAEVVVSPALWEFLDDVAEGQRKSNGCIAVTSLHSARTAKPAASAAAPWQVDAFVSPSIRALLQAAETEWSSEFRTSSVLLARFLGEIDSIAADAERLQALTLAIQTAVNNREGAIFQYGTDEKGLILLAAWGLATNAHENDAARAVLAALDIRDAARTAGLRAGIALRCGKVFAGVLGNSGYRQHCIISDIINDAAGMMVAADGEIFCDSTIADLAGRRIEFERAPELQLKGRSQPLAVFRPVREQNQRSVASRQLIGRADEFARVVSLLDQYRPDQPAPLIWIEGDAGIGKSQFAEACIQAAAADGWKVLRCEADDLNRSAPFHAWRELFSSILADAGPPDHIAGWQARLGNLPNWKARLPLLGTVLNQQFPETDLVRGMDAMQRSEATRRLLVDILAPLLDTQRTLLAVEDAHWLDSLSWQLLADIRQRMPACALLIATRLTDPSALPAEAQLLFADAALTRLPLRPLTRAATELLIRDLLEAESVPPEVTDRVFERAGGHPLYTRELVATLRDEGILRVHNRHSHVAAKAIGLRDVVFPDSAQSAIAGRLSRLEPATQLTLKVASVLGPSFSPELLAEIRPIASDADVLHRHLQDAIEAGMVCAPEARGGEHRFQHAIVRETIYGQLLLEQRRQLHRAAAEALQRRRLGNDSASAPVLAHHWEGSDFPERSIEFYLRAGADAERNRANIEVVRFLSAALEQSLKRPEGLDRDSECSLRMRIAAAHLDLGRVNEVEPHLRVVVAARSRPVPIGRQLPLRLLRELMAFKIRDLTARRSRIGTGDDDARNGLVQASDAYIMLGWAHFERQMMTEALFDTIACANLALRAGVESEALARSYANLSTASAYLPWLIDGVRCRDASLAIAARVDRPGCSYWTEFSAGNFDFSQGLSESSLRHLETAEQIARQHLPRSDLEIALAAQSVVLRGMGRFREAQEIESDVLASARARGVLMLQVWALNGMIRNTMALGDVAAFRTAVDRLASLLNDPDNRLNASANNYITLLHARAYANLAEGSIETAIQNIEAAVQAFAAIKMPQFYTSHICGLAADLLRLIAVAAPGSPRLIATARTNERSARKLGRLFPRCVPARALAAGDLAAMRGRPARAVRYWQRAVEAARSLNLPYDAAQALHRLAEADALTTSARGAHLRDRDALLARLGIGVPMNWTGASGADTSSRPASTISA